MSGGSSPVEARPLPDSEVKEVVETWVDILKTPTIAGAYVVEDNNFLTVNSRWSVDDAAKKERIAYSRTFGVLKSSLESGGKPVICSSGSSIVDEKLSVVSRYGKNRAVLVEKAGADVLIKSEFIQIWNQDKLYKSYNLAELDLHKSVYTSAGWGITMAWSESGTKLAYLAEKKPPKVKSFYSSASSAAPKACGACDFNPVESIPEKKADVEIGEEYIYKQSWGEQLTGAYFSVVVVLDITTDVFKVLRLPEDQFPTDIQWIGDSHICGTTYPLPIWRLGLIYCTNRESIIFSVQADDGENFQLLTEANRAARSARPTPDGDYLVWQERILDGAHDRSRSIFGATLSDGQISGQPQLLYDANPENEMPVFDDFARNCWSPDGTTLYATTANEAQNICLAFSYIESGSPMQVKKIEAVDSVLAVTNKYLLVGSSSTLTTQQLRLLDISQDFRSIPITESVRAVDFQTIQQMVTGEFSPPSIFTGPAIETVPPNSIPLVVYPHGGPHSCFVDTYSAETVLFLKLGFAVLRLNYVGSTGGNRDTADDLLGRIGDRDVKDCQGMVEKVLNSNPSLNPDKVVAFGGSHGGFLSAHLLGQYPDVYKAAVMRNPVTDVGTMVGMTDITDWTYAEAGVTFPEYPVQTLIPTFRNLMDADKYIKASPIHYAEKVKGATLLLLGSEDLRVPAFQGMNYYRALKAHNKIAEIRMYPDCHSLFKPPVRVDNIIHSALFIKRYLR